MSNHFSSDTGARKIDDQAANGLLGVEDSVAYETQEISVHLHHENICYGNDGSNNLLQDSTTAFQITSGSSGAFGTELQIHDGTVIESGSTTKKVDFDRIVVSAANAGAGERYIVQIWCGTTTFAAATKCTSFWYLVPAVNNRGFSFEATTKRFPCNHKIWIRCKCSANAKTIDLLFGAHTYIGQQKVKG